MTSKASAPGGRGPDRLSIWCGYVLLGAAVLTPLLAWLAPLGFAALLALVGLLTLPAFRVTRDDRPVFGLLLAAVAWAGLSTLWSGFRPRELEEMTALKLALQLPLYWTALCAARRASPRLARAALWVLAGGMALLGGLLAYEAWSGAAIYLRLHEAFYEPIRLDLAQKNSGQPAFVLALLWPLLAAGVARPRWGLLLALPMIAGGVAVALAFDFDAPLFAFALAPLAGAAALLAPRLYPRVLALKATIFFLAAPVIVWGVRQAIGLEQIQAALALSWGQRVGYWSFALDRIGEHPLLGWGLDASRTFAPAIHLHPHDSALQVWLELGAVGAGLATAFWSLVLRRQARATPNLSTAALIASVFAYLLFGALNFGIWQEWWLALGAYVAVLAALVARAAPAAERQMVQPST